MVLVSHSWALTGNAEPSFPLTHDTLGFVGVLIFFAISGYLITQSWTRDPHVISFVWKRVLRVVPALLVMLLVTTYIVGTLASPFSPSAYLADTRVHRYFLDNLLMWTQPNLVDVFSTNPNPSMNGSLGTLPVEIKAYVFVLVVGLIFATRHRARRVLLVGCLVAAVWIALSTGVKPVHTLAVLFAVFTGAAALRLAGGRVAPRTGLFVLLLGTWILSYHLPYGVHVVLTAMAFPYVVLFLAQRWLHVFRFLCVPGDVSYGIFIWAFPIQQSLVHVWTGISPWALLAVALPVTYVVALVSWHVIERPSLGKKHWLARPKEGRTSGRAPYAPSGGGPASARSTS